MSAPTTNNSKYDFDLIVLGGGSGGLAAAKEAAKVAPGAKIAVFDYVTPTPHGTRWGLGGTCVNVGCIPKKLMHYAGTLGGQWHDHAGQFGWSNTGDIKHDWGTMSHLITDYIQSLNFSYRVQLRSQKVKYYESYARFVDAHTVEFKGNTAANTGKVTFDKAIIATGGRPTYGVCKGSELAITSDDIFWRETSPGKTLVIGAGYIALECASFMHHLGLDISVMVRGQPLRKMDRQSGHQVAELMERSGIRFLVPASPLSFEKVNKSPVPADAKQILHPHSKESVWQLSSSTDTVLHLLHESGSTEVIDLTSGRSEWKIPEGPIKVTYKFNDHPDASHTEIFDNVLLAVGRTANTAYLNLPAVGVHTVHHKILVDAYERTTAPHVYAIGDVATGVPKIQGFDMKVLEANATERPELTPVAIKAGILLANRLFGKTEELMLYQYIPTSVFTSPSEYSYVGLSEEEARRPEDLGGVGSENVGVYYSRFGTIEISPTHPHNPPARSTAFSGKNTWSHQQVETRNVDWAEVTFDNENNSSVLYTTSDGSKVPALVLDKSRDEHGKIVYEIQREDNQEMVSGVSGKCLELQPELAKENDALFEKAQCLAKLVIDKRNDRVVGLHFVGPNAGEVVQGFTLALKMGATKKQFDDMVGIHPIAAEEFAVLTVTRDSGATPLKKAGCGGGSCG